MYACCSNLGPVFDICMFHDSSKSASLGRVFILLAFDAYGTDFSSTRYRFQVFFCRFGHCWTLIWRCPAATQAEAPKIVPCHPEPRNGICGPSGKGFLQGFERVPVSGNPGVPDRWAGYPVPLKPNMRMFIFASNKCGVRLGTKVWTKILLHVPPSRACI